MNENENLPVPDFSDPEFENDKDVKRWREQKKAHLKYIEDSARIVSNSFKASKFSHKNLKRFELHKAIDTPFIIQSYLGSQNRKKIFFSIIQYHTSASIPRGNLSGTDEYFVGVIALDRFYPHTIILPETAAIKINNLFVPGDVDFKHAKSFSFRFHVVTKDEDKLKSLFERVDLDRLNKFRSAEIELKESQCYFRANRKPVSPEQAQVFTDLAKTICEIF